MRIPLGRGAYNRTYNGGPEVELYNRFFEANPTNRTDEVGLLARPGTTLEAVLGAGPIRQNFTLKGLFDSDLFSVSDTALYRYKADGTIVTISGSVTSPGNPRMAGVSGAAYQRLFIADGTLLQFYGGESYTATLTLTPGTISDDVVIIDGIYYQFQTTPPSAGAGTLASPYRVAVAGSNANALANLRKAVNGTGVAGTDYSTGLVANARVESNANSSTTVSVRNRGGGAPFPAIPVSVTATGGADGLAWSSANLVASGLNALSGIKTPDDVGISSVTVLSSYILCVVANSQRVYWIEPGEITINPLNFFEAESEPDTLIDAITIGDQVWFFGQSSTEPWYLDGTDPNAPFVRVAGRPFARGALQGTVVKLADSVFIVGDDNIVYRVAGGPTPISDAAISEKIRLALEIERTS